jgi:hypothetical protein
MNYILFAGNNYYPEGGWNDFAGMFETIEAAKKRGTELLNRKRVFASDSNWDWAHIVDVKKYVVIAYCNERVEWEWKEI